MDCVTHYICHICQREFVNSQSLNGHMKCHSKHKNMDKRTCPICHNVFTRAYDMRKHVENMHSQGLQLPTHCVPIPENVPQKEVNLHDLYKKINDLELELKQRDEKNNNDLRCELKQINNEINEIKKKPCNTTNVLNILCVGNQDNYLDMLKDKFGNFDQAIEYIKDCALANLTGDCKLIHKVYSDENNGLCFKTNKNRSEMYYHDEKQQPRVESKEAFSGRIINNLQNSYLKGINYLINRNLDQKINPINFLEQYDISAWNGHIYQLSDQQYRRKIMSTLEIPIGNVHM